MFQISGVAKVVGYFSRVLSKTSLKLQQDLTDQSEQNLIH